MQIIDYAHVQDGVLLHGTLSDLDGSPKVTWTYEQAGRKVQRTSELPVGAFASLCAAFTDQGFFQRNQVYDMEREVDPISDHVIAFITQEGSEPWRRYYAIPAGEEDPAFLEWLAALDRPQPGAAAQPTQTGAAAIEVGRLTEQREAVYPKFFGAGCTVHRDTGPDPRVNVYEFAPGDDPTGRREFTTLVTGGLSNRPLPLPEGAPFRRVELLLYVEKATERQVDVLRWMARLPYEKEGWWYGPGTTLNNGDPPEPVFEGSEVDCFVLLEPIVGRDNRLLDELVLDGDPTTALWVVPITRYEREFIIQRGIGPFLDVLDRREHPFVLDEHRPSYISPDLDVIPAPARKPWWRFW